MLPVILNDTVVALIAVLLSSCVSDAGETREALSLTFNPNSHAGFEVCRLRERIEAHP